VARITVRSQRSQEREGYGSRWVERTVGNASRKLRDGNIVRLLGLTAKGDLLLEFKLAYSVGDQLIQLLDELEQEAERTGRVARRRDIWHDREATSILGRGALVALSRIVSPSFGSFALGCGVQDDVRSWRL
jgi:hypothetical protein